MFRILVIQNQNNPSDDRTEFLINDRLSFMCFPGPGDLVPDARTIRLFREHLMESGVLSSLFKTFDPQLAQAGYSARGGQVVNASLIATPRQRLREDEKQAVKEGCNTREIWPEAPKKAAQKDVDARWAVQQFRQGKGGRQDPDLWLTGAI